MSPTERWHAVLARDRRFDGAFVYAVRSTGIYCRPSCASRRPRRTQVTFFPIPEAAEREGFRALRSGRVAAPAGPKRPVSRAARPWGTTERDAPLAAHIRRGDSGRIPAVERSAPPHLR